MNPQAVAPILGLTANGVSALAYRAREVLRTAWLQAHVTDAGATADCRWVTGRLGENARDSLTSKEKTRFDTHRDECERCGLLASEVDEVGSSIAVVLLPLLLGTTVGGALLAMVGPAQSAAALALPAVPAAFQTVVTGGTPAAVVAAGTAATTGASVPFLAGAPAVTVVLGGGAAAMLQPTSAAAPTMSTHSSQPVATPDPEGNEFEGTGETNANGDGTSDPVTDLVGNITDPVGTLLPKLPVGPVPDHMAPEGVVGAVVDLDLNGTGMPGATISAQVAGQAYTTGCIERNRGSAPHGTPGWCRPDHAQTESQRSWNSRSDQHPTYAPFGHAWDHRSAVDLTSKIFLQNRVTNLRVLSLSL